MWVEKMKIIFNNFKAVKIQLNEKNIPYSNMYFNMIKKLNQFVFLNVVKYENLFFRKCSLFEFFKDNDSHNLDMLMRQNGRHLSSSFLQNRTNSLSRKIHKSYFIAERKYARTVVRGQRQRKRINERD